MNTLILLLMVIKMINCYRGNILPVAQSCPSYPDSFWYVYVNHFVLVKNLTIHILQTENHKSDLDAFIEKLFNTKNWLDAHITFTIQVTYLNETKHFRNHSFYNNRSYRTGPRVEPITYANFYHSKTLSSGSVKGYFLIVWDVETLHRFVDEDFRTVIPEARATYALQFTFDSSNPRTEIAGILKRLWIEYNVVNIVAQTPCSYDQERVYIYRPFVKTNDTWGLLESYTLDQILDNLRTITNPLDDFNQFPLDIGIYVREPSALLDLPKHLSGHPLYKNLSFSKDFVGVDGLILGTLAENFNFGVNIIGNVRDGRFGMLLPDGKVSKGALKDVCERKIAYSANNRFLMHYDNLEVEFTVPHGSEDLCVIAPKASKIPKWRSLFNSFSRLSWISLILVCLLSTVCCYYLQANRNWMRAAWIMFSYFSGVPAKIVAPKTAPLVFLTGCMVSQIVISGIMQGSLFTGFTTTRYYPDLNTLEEVDQSGLLIASPVWSFVEDDSELITHFKEKTIRKLGNIHDVVATYRNVVTTETRSFVEYLVKTRYMNSDGSPRLHVVNECISTYLSSHIVPKGSAFLSIFNDAITKMVEAGLTDKWNRDVVDSVIIDKLISMRSNQTDDEAVSLSDVKFAFWLFLAGHIVSVVAFLGECIARRTKM